ncbi:MAG: xanthine dehydrogenase family protein molybdopterin-binding subunit [Treponema sp.]|jgi:CO/xanthine dehydrogenase Mo-binding subunit|nr:xanthine dehydrogenase family protein molybdopterin-binding subunit [Treponema sp.]
MTQKFVTDIYPQGGWFAVTLRSPVAKGVVKSINRPPNMPPSYMLVTANDIPGVNEIDDFPAPVLAEKLSYIGEPVALLVGPNEVEVEKYASQCEIVCEEEKPSFSNLSTNSGASAFDGVVLAERTILLGAPFKTDTVKTTVQGVYRTGVQEHWYAEPHAAVASIDSQGKITIHTATQWAFHVRRSVGKMLKLPLEMITVVLYNTSMHFDGKLWYPSLISCHAALAAFAAGKPARLCLTREEDFRFSPKRNASEIRITSSLDEKGDLLGNDISVAADLGAAGVFTNEIVDNTCLGALGFYQTPFISMKAKCAQTNVPVQGPFSGFGLAQGFFAAERHASRVADTLRIDPAEWRKRHFLRKNKRLAIGIPIQDQGNMDAVMETVEAMSDYKRKWASYELLRQRVRENNAAPFRGIGVAAAYQGSGFLHASGADKGNYTVEATLKEDDTLEIRASAAPSNGSWERVVRLLAAKILALDENSVTVNNESADAAPDSGPSSASRTIAVITRLAARCCLALKKERGRAALPFVISRSVKPSNIHAWSGSAQSIRTYAVDKNAFSPISWGAAVVEIEIEQATYIPKIRGIWLCIDGGRILSEQHARRAVAVSAMHALGWASREKLSYIDGAISDEFMYNYDIPSPIDIPPIAVSFLESAKKASKPKGIGEIPFCTIPAAYAQAVSQSLDHVFEEIPLRPEDIWVAVQGDKK